MAVSVWVYFDNFKRTRIEIFSTSKYCVYTIFRCIYRSRCSAQNRKCARLSYVYPIYALLAFFFLEYNNNILCAAAKYTKFRSLSRRIFSFNLRIMGAAVLLIAPPPPRPLRWLAKTVLLAIFVAWNPRLWLCGKRFNGLRAVGMGCTVDIRTIYIICYIPYYMIKIIKNDIYYHHTYIGSYLYYIQYIHIIYIK